MYHLPPASLYPLSGCAEAAGGPSSRLGKHIVALQNGKRIELELRRHRVIQMKIAGASERQIAEQEGVSPATIFKDVKAGLKAHADASSKDREELRSLMMLRYERLVMTWWPLAIGGDYRAAEILRGYLADIRTINGLDPKGPLVVTNNQFNQEVLQLDLSPTEIAETLAILYDAGVIGQQRAIAPPDELHTPPANGQAEGLSQP